MKLNVLLYTAFASYILALSVTCITLPSIECLPILSSSFEDMFDAYDSFEKSCDKFTSCIYNI